MQILLTHRELYEIIPKQLEQPRSAETVNEKSLVTLRTCSGTSLSTKSVIKTVRNRDANRQAETELRVESQQVIESRDTEREKQRLKKEGEKEEQK